jgi:uncharacterized protein YukE
MAMYGMNIQDVRTLAALLQRKSDEIRQLVSEVDGKVHSTTWEGPDAQRFKNDWWPQHKSHLLQVADQIHGFGQSANNNAAEQENVSNR